MTSKVTDHNLTFFKLHSALEVILRDTPKTGAITTHELKELMALFPDLSILCKVVKVPRNIQADVDVLAELQPSFNPTELELHQYLERIIDVETALIYRPSIIAYREIHKGYELVSLNMNGTFHLVRKVQRDVDVVELTSRMNHQLNFTPLTVNNSDSEKNIPVMTYEDRRKKIISVGDVDRQYGGAGG
jgi:hypothetical protein